MTLVTSSQDAAFQHDYSLPYPIFASFQDWLYPHDKLPPDFNALPRLPLPPALSTFPISQYSTAVKCRDETCRLTGAFDPCESAHLIPVSETRWFGEQDMSKYANKRHMSVQDWGNLFLLRSDIHKLFDAGKWIPYPKTILVEGVMKSRLIFHSLEYLPQLRGLYQNVPLRETQGLCPEFLLARFAFAIFPQVEQFLQNGADRYLIRVNANTQTAKSEIVNGSELVRTYPVLGVRRGSRTPSHSPTKRSRDSIMDQLESSIALGELTSIWNSSRQKRCRSASEDKQTRSNSHLPKRRRSASEDKQTKSNPHPPKRRRNVSDPRPTKTHEEVDHASFIPSLRLRNGPCQCPSSSKDQELLTPISSPASIPFGKEEESNFWHSQRRVRECDSRFCPNRMERERLTRLREEALRLERIKSGTDVWWTTVEEWYLRTMDRGGTISQPTIRKWLWFQGAEEQELVDGAGDLT